MITSPPNPELIFEIIASEVLKQKYERNCSAGCGGLKARRGQAFLLLPLNSLQFNKHGKDKINPNMQIKIVIL